LVVLVLAAWIGSAPLLKPLPPLARAAAIIPAILAFGGMALLTFATVSRAAEQDLWVRVIPGAMKLMWIASFGGTEYVPPKWTFEVAAWIVPMALLAVGVIGWRRATRGLAIGSRDRFRRMAFTIREHIDAQRKAGSR
jgi:hypothetical protein